MSHLKFPLLHLLMGSLENALPLLSVLGPQQPLNCGFINMARVLRLKKPMTFIAPSHYPPGFYRLTLLH